MISDEANMTNGSSTQTWLILWLGFKSLKGQRATTMREFTFYYHLIDLERMKNWIDLGDTHWILTQLSWIENPAP